MEKAFTENSIPMMGGCEPQKLSLLDEAVAELVEGVKRYQRYVDKLEVVLFTPKVQKTETEKSPDNTIHGVFENIIHRLNSTNNTLEEVISTLERHFGELKLE